MDVQCPSCNAITTCSSEYAGRQVKCNKCLTQFVATAAQANAKATAEAEVWSAVVEDVSIAAKDDDGPFVEEVKRSEPPMVRPRKATSSRASNLITTGVFLATIGGALMGLGVASVCSTLQMETTVRNYHTGEYVYNSGLLNEQQNGVMVSCTTGIIGTILFGFGTFLRANGTMQKDSHQ